MAGERYADYAVVCLHDVYSDNFATQLDDVISDQSLEAADLPDPVAIIRGPHIDDPRSPLLQVFDVGGTFSDPAGQRNKIADIDCRVVLTYLSSPDLPTGALTMRRYLTAMIQTIEVDPTLGGLVNAAIINRWDFEAPEIEGNAACRLQLGMDVVVRVRSD